MVGKELLKIFLLPFLFFLSDACTHIELTEHNTQSFHFNDGGQTELILSDGHFILLRPQQFQRGSIFLWQAIDVTKPFTISFNTEETMCACQTCAYCAGPDGFSIVVQNEYMPEEFLGDMGSGLGFKRAPYENSIGFLFNFFDYCLHQPFLSVFKNPNITYTIPNYTFPSNVDYLCPNTSVVLAYNGHEIFIGFDGLKTEIGSQPFISFPFSFNDSLSLINSSLAYVGISASGGSSYGLLKVNKLRISYTEDNSNFPPRYFCDSTGGIIYDSSVLPVKLNYTNTVVIASGNFEPIYFHLENSTFILRGNFALDENSVIELTPSSQISLQITGCATLGGKLILQTNFSYTNSNFTIPIAQSSCFTGNFSIIEFPNNGSQCGDIIDNVNQVQTDSIFYVTFTIKRHFCENSDKNGLSGFILGLSFVESVLVAVAVGIIFIAVATCVILLVTPKFRQAVFPYRDRPRHINNY